MDAYTCPTHGNYAPNRFCIACNREEIIGRALPHIVRVMDALEKIKDEQHELGFTIEHASWATAADALTDIKDAMYKLGVPGDLIHDYPERLPRKTAA